MTRKVSGNIFGFTQRRCEVSDESRERILTLSHSPSVIKPSQAMGVHEIAMQAIGCCEKEHPYSQLRLTRLTLIANGVVSG